MNSKLPVKRWISKESGVNRNMKLPLKLIITLYFHDLTGDTVTIFNVAMMIVHI